MTEMKIQDSVLPFKCSNPDCGQEYDQALFARTAFLWGFILLISEEDDTALVGLTCPKCKKTTLKKYRAHVGLDLLCETWSYLKDNGRVKSNIPLRDRWCGKYYSANHLFKSGHIETPYSETEDKGKTTYLIPPEVRLEEYSKKLHEEQPFSLVEDDIPFVLDIENKLSFKAIPRTIPNPGFFSRPNGINYGLDCMLLDPTYDTVTGIMCGMLKPNYALYKKIIKHNEDNFDFSTVSWQKIKLPQGKEDWHLAHNDLLVEEYDHFRISFLSWKRKSFQDNFDRFIKELNEIRNKIDCEQKVKNSLINKYGRIFYFKTIRLEEIRAELNEMVDIDDAGGIEAYLLGDDPADSSDAVPVSTDKMTPKEAVIHCCQKTAQQLLVDGTCKSIADVLRTTNEFEACFKGFEEYKVSERRLRQWLEDLNYDPSAGRRPGT